MEGIHSSREPAFTPIHFRIAAVLLTAIFVGLVARVYVLQLMRGEKYVQKSESNFVQRRRIAHSRGLIFDQAGKPLVDNRPSHDLYMTSAFLPDSTRSLRLLGASLGWEKGRIKALDRDIINFEGTAAESPRIVEPRLDAELCEELQQTIEKKALTGVEVVDLHGNDVGRCALAIDRLRFSSRKAVFLKLKGLLELEPDVVDEAFDTATKKSRGLGRFKPTLLLADIPTEAYVRISSALAMGELPGIDIADSKKRRGLHGALATHVLGFVNELSGEEYRSRRKLGLGYRLGDKTGRRGIERAYEDHLRGTDGVLRVVVDAKGRAKNTPWAKALLGDDARTEPVAGASITLSIDMRLQRAAENAFLGQAGSVVAIDVNTGFILAMASLPDYDPNAVTGRESRTVWRGLAKDPLKPLGNKALQDHYAPGSTFKSITAVAGLRHKLITPTSVRHCPGYFRLGRARWRCYNRGGHGQVALKKALQHSCDTYFYSLGYELGHDRLAETARLLGFGERPGLGIDREIPGIIPTVAYYKKRFKSASPGLVVNSSIGQGDINVTPLQLGLAYSAIVNGGKAYKPQIVHNIRAPDGTIIESFLPEERGELGVDPELLAVVAESLSYVTEKGGTAYGLNWRRDLPELSKWMRESGVRIGGKTGTAQVVRLSKSVAHVDPKDVPYLQRDHAWFVGFAPAEAPEIVVVTMTEHGGFGGSMSAPVTAAVIKEWYDEVRGHGRYENYNVAPVPVPASKWYRPKKKTPEEVAAEAAEAGEAAEVNEGVHSAAEGDAHE